MPLQLSCDEIEKLIPHRPPFLFVDKVTDASDLKIEAIWHVKENADFFKGHFPRFPITPGVILQESLFQTAAILMAKTLENSNDQNQKIPMVVKIEKTRFKKPVLPGDICEQIVELVSRDGDFLTFKGKIVSDKKTRVVCQFTCVLAEVEKNHE